MTGESKMRKFYVGFTFFVDDGYGSRRISGNMGMEFHNLKIGMDMFMAAKTLIKKQFELENAESVVLTMFVEMEE